MFVRVWYMHTHSVCVCVWCMCSAIVLASSSPTFAALSETQSTEVKITMYDLAFGAVQPAFLLMTVKRAWRTCYSAGALKADRAGEILILRKTSH